MTTKKVGGIYHWKGIIANSFDLCYHCFTSVSVFSTRALVSVRIIESLIISVEMATPMKIKLRFLKRHHKALCCLILHVTSQYNLDPSLYQCGHAYLPHTQSISVHLSPEYINPFPVPPARLSRRKGCQWLLFSSLILTYSKALSHCSCNAKGHARRYKQRKHTNCRWSL